ncbi:MAG: GNAT family protein [Chloroflexota bacterium]
MSDHYNHLNQPIGFPLEGWQPRSWPERKIMTGRYCRVEPIDSATHGADLHQANIQAEYEGFWTYLPYGPFETPAAYQRWLQETCLGEDPFFYAIVDTQTNKAVGVASYLRIEPTIGVIEVGHINYAPALQKTPAATEAMYLMMAHVFDDLGYRRYEWKCDALNAGSRKAALRLGFTFEGIFRQATMYKGRNRDTAWFSILDTEWPQQKQAFEAWLNPSNFDEQGQQKSGLARIEKS